MIFVWLFVKLFAVTLLLIWLSIVMFIWIGWLVVALVQVCTRLKVSRFPRGVNQVTAQFAHWVV